MTEIRQSSRSVLLAYSLTLAAMRAFAGNSILCRMALFDTAIDAARFTNIRLLSGALAIALRGGSRTKAS